MITSFSFRMILSGDSLPRFCISNSHAFYRVLLMYYRHAFEKVFLFNKLNYVFQVSNNVCTGMLFFSFLNSSYSSTVKGF